MGVAHSLCKDDFALDPPLWKSLAVLYYFNLFFGGVLGRNKPSGFLPAVTARLLRVLYIEGKSDGWERSVGVQTARPGLITQPIFTFI